MPFGIDSQHRFFDLSDDSAEAALRWARRLAVLIGALTLLSASFLMLFPVEDGGRNVLLRFTSGLAYLLLASYRDAVRATAVLCVITLLIALPDSSGPFVVTLVELMVFGLGFRGAIALSRDAEGIPRDLNTGSGSTATAHIDVSTPSAWRRPVAEVWAGVQQLVVDVIVGLLTIGMGVRVFQIAAGISPEGDMIGGALAFGLIATVIVSIGALLIIAGIASYRTKAWGTLLRGTIYLALSALALGYVAIRVRMI